MIIMMSIRRDYMKVRRCINIINCGRGLEKLRSSIGGSYLLRCQSKSKLRPRSLSAESYLADGRNSLGS